MLLVDVSSVMYTGASAQAMYVGTSSDHKLNSIPYLFSKLSSYYSIDKNVLLVMESIGKIPALAQSGDYKGGRQRNPKVELENRLLPFILDLAGIPYITRPYTESDHIISNYCRQYGNSEDIYILSADHDIACNVRDGQYSTEILSFSSMSYNINKNNFKEITGVDYNFMDIHKLTNGCKSDKIKPLKEGQRIYDSYLASVRGDIRRTYGINTRQIPMSEINDSIINRYNGYGAFVSWLMESEFYTPDIVNSLDERARKIIGDMFDVKRPPAPNWERYNELVKSLYWGKSLSIQQLNPGVPNPEFQEMIIEQYEKLQGNFLEDVGIDNEALDSVVTDERINQVLGLLDDDGGEY